MDTSKPSVAVRARKSARTLNRKFARSRALGVSCVRGEKSLRYWENPRGVVSQRFDRTTDRREPRFQELLRYSPAMHLAIQAVTGRNPLWRR